MEVRHVVRAGSGVLAVGRRRSGFARVDPPIRHLAPDRECPRSSPGRPAIRSRSARPAYVRLRVRGAPRWLARVPCAHDFGRSGDRAHRGHRRGGRGSVPVALRRTIRSHRRAGGRRRDPALDRRSRRSAPRRPRWRDPFGRPGSRCGSIQRTPGRDSREARPSDRSLSSPARIPPRPSLAILWCSKLSTNSSTETRLVPRSQRRSRPGISSGLPARSGGSHEPQGRTALFPQTGPSRRERRVWRSQRTHV